MTSSEQETTTFSREEVGPSGRCPHCDCPNKYCYCISSVAIEGAERRESEAVAEAYRLRLLWEAAASCLAHNAEKIKPRGADERRMIEAAVKKGPQGKFWSGRTDGWIK